MAGSAPIPFGDYLLLERIGVGGTAEVFRAVRRGRRPGEPEVALKRLLTWLAQDSELSRMFLREVGALSRIDHPAVVRLLEHGEAAGLPYLVMPLLDGCSLRRLLQGPAGDDSAPQPLTLLDALWLTARLAQGLAAAHRQGIVHRDVSPSNVQVTSQGQVLLLDFGIARVAGLALTTQGRSLKGKWAYLSPEQVTGGVIDGRSDLFALGSVLVECIVGKAPFATADRNETLLRVQGARFEGIQDLPAIVAEPLGSLIQRLLAVDPAQRPQDGDQVAEMLTALMERLESGSGHSHVRPSLAARVALVPPRVAAVSHAAALRGQAVTNATADEDVTQVGRQTV